MVSVPLVVIHTVFLVVFLRCDCFYWAVISSLDPELRHILSFKGNFEFFLFFDGLLEEVHLILLTLESCECPLRLGVDSFCTLSFIFIILLLLPNLDNVVSQVATSPQQSEPLHNLLQMGGILLWVAALFVFSLDLVDERLDPRARIVIGRRARNILGLDCSG